MYFFTLFCPSPFRAFSSSVRGGFDQKNAQLAPEGRVLCALSRNLSPALKNPVVVSEKPDFESYERGPGMCLEGFHDGSRCEAVICYVS